MDEMSRFAAVFLVAICMVSCTCAVIAEIRELADQLSPRIENTEQAEYWAEWNSVAPVAHAADCHCDTCCYQKTRLK